MNVRLPWGVIIAATLWPVTSWGVGFSALGRLPDTNQSRATDVSQTGSVAGTSDNTAFRWTLAGGLQSLGVQTQTPPVISGNGAVVAGGRATVVGSGRALWRWTAGGGAVDISPASALCSHASSMSYDGSLLTSFADQTIDSGAFQCKWTSSGGLVGLSGLPDHIQFYSRAMIDLGGDDVIGESGVNHLPHGFLWHAGTPVANTWLCNTPADPFEVGVGCSPAQMTQDGAFVAGATFIGNIDQVDPGHAFRWTPGAGLEDLGELAGGADASAATSLDGMGRRVVGWGTTVAGQEAMLWDAAHGMRRVVDVLASYGVAVPIGWTLRGASRISTNGRFLVGYGDHIGHTEAWRVELADLPTVLLRARWFVGQLPPSAVTKAMRTSLLARLNLAYQAAVKLPSLPFLVQSWTQLSVAALLKQMDAKTQSCGSPGSSFLSCPAADTLDDYLQDALLWLPGSGF